MVRRRGRAAILLTLISGAAAGRELKSSRSGSLQGVALVKPVPGDAGTSSSLPATGDLQVLQMGPYMITNGNGSWTYTYFSPGPGNRNGNDADMGGDWQYPSTNVAWFNSNGAAGANYNVLVNAFVLPFFTSLVGSGAQFAKPVTTSPTVANVAGILQLESPLARFTIGLNKITFTSSKLGIAVGVFGAMGGLDDSMGSANQFRILNGALTGARGLAHAAAGITESGFANYANILLTYDGAATWVRASGVPRPNALASVGTLTTDAGLQLQQSIVVGTGGVAGGSGSPPYPPLTPGEFTDIHMASKSLGWAVGGNAIHLAAVVSTSVGLAGACNTNQYAGSGCPANTAFPYNQYGGEVSPTGSSMPLAYVYITTNGGSVWKYVPIYFSKQALTVLWRQGKNADLRSAFAVPIPGILFGVGSDGAGKHVFAVGSPATTWSTSPTADTKLVDNTAAALGIVVKKVPTILYSGNSGFTWTMQTAPSLWQATTYALFDVAVQKASTAIAVGGSPYYTHGTTAAGAILYTINGGSTWLQAVYPSSTESKVPTLTCVSIQPSSNGAQRVWVGGHTSRTDSPVIGTGTANGFIAGADFYPVAAVAGFNTVNGQQLTTNQPATKGKIYTILISDDGGKSFVPAPAASFPASFVKTSFTMTSASTYLVQDGSTYGISWQNSRQGWIFGYGYILSTNDGGNTWQDETPLDVGQLVTPQVGDIAVVP